MSQIEIKILQLVKTESKKKEFRWKYEVIEDGIPICDRHSNREYVACFIECNLNPLHKKHPYSIPFMFGRLDLIGNGNSRGTQPYAIGLLNLEDKVNVPGLTLVVKMESAMGSVTIIGY